MRYLGNKDSIATVICDVITQKTHVDEDCVFFDAFCGMGSISNSFKDICRVIINDNLKCATTYSYGRLQSSNCSFDRLGFDPFDYFNNSDGSIRGYFYTTYSPGGSDRMYFTPENAARIDFFRTTIEEWNTRKLLTQEEYCYLLACLIESVSFVSNTAGVYGAFLKTWDDRALKRIEFLDVSDGKKCINPVEVYSEKIEDIISKVDCDVIYLDPPYTQNQYGTQYHLLETLVLNDKPSSVSRVTGSRATAPMRSDWSKKYKVHILFDKIIAETKAKHIFLSYNNAGDMSKEYIEAIMKRYGYEETFECIKIPYKKYENWKSQNSSKHFEYLFYIEKKPADQVIYESPLNYIGSKAKVIQQIRDNSLELPVFVDLFGGGMNVGINSFSNTVIYNDLNFRVTDIIRSLKEYDTYEYIVYVKKFIEKHGLEKGNKETYIKARTYYNSLPENKKDIRMLFALILYGFQQQIRFNSNYEFNNPVGVRWFNDFILAKMVSFARIAKLRDIEFFSLDYINVEDSINFDENTFIYLDPPYKLTTGSYNDGKRGFKGWDDTLEKELLQYLDALTHRNIKWMLSYVIEHKGKKNYDLDKWINDNGYKCIHLGDIIGVSGQPRKEILVINYEL